MTDDRPQSIVQGATQVGTSAVESMRSVPLAIALLMVNIGFLAFNGYVLSVVGANAAERNKTQAELILKLVGEIRDCTRHSTLQQFQQQSQNSPVFKIPPATKMKEETK